MMLRRPPALRRTWTVLATAAMVLTLGTAALPGGAPAGQPSAAAPTVRTVEHADAVTEGGTVEVDRARAITATGPRTVVTGSRVVVSGVVRVHAGRRARPRPVRLLESTPSGWRVLARRSTARTGSFRFDVAAGSRGRTRVLQVRARRFEGLRAARTPRVVVHVVRPSGGTPPPTAAPVSEQAPAGFSGDWSFLFTDGGSRWNPCTAIRWAYNPQGGYAGALAHLQEAFARIASRTGLTFQYVGETTHVHRTGSTFPSYADIALAWSDETRVPELRGSVAGIGGGSAQRATAGEDVAWRMVRGHVVLDRGEVLRQGFDTSGSTTWGQVMVHETLHAAGLGHASGAEQVMHGSVSSLNHRFGAGDVTGMTRIGAGGGCL